MHSTPSGMHYVGTEASFSDTCLGAASVASAATALEVTTTTTEQLETEVKQMPHHHHHGSQNHHHHHNHHHRMPMRVSTTKRDSKTAKTLTIVMGGLIACWLPFFVYYLLIPFLPRPAVLEDLMFGFTWIGWVNCAINPFIYAFYNPDFRTAFWRLTCRPICKQKRPPNHLAMFRG